MPSLALIATAQRLDDAAGDGADVDGKQDFRRITARKCVGGLESRGRICLPVGKGQNDKVTPSGIVFGEVIRADIAQDTIWLVRVFQRTFDCILDTLRFAGDAERLFQINTEAGERHRNANHAGFTHVIATARAGVIFATFDNMAEVAETTVAIVAERDRANAGCLRDSASEKDRIELVHGMILVWLHHQPEITHRRFCQFSCN
ncbi:hypothetical protein AGR5A_Cc90329 [Agrobacterium genomosp. 5 str. CFBP 6626]|nr:hypothetical protein AGR5A_Cc90329 [Agrobacterium genomosp. 5 str. CFBP 6626]